MGTKILNFLKVSWVWIKGHMALIVLFLGMGFLVLFAKNKAENFEMLLKAYKDQQDANKKNLAEIQKIQQEEAAKQLEISRKYAEIVKKIEDNYQEELLKLDKAKKEEIRVIVARNNDDPEAMAREINGLFQIPILQNSNSGQ